MRQIVGIASVVITPPSRSESAPIVALTATPGGDGDEHAAEAVHASRAAAAPDKARIRMMATATSSTLPHVWPIADPSGSAL